MHGNYCQVGKGYFSPPPCRVESTWVPVNRILITGQLIWALDTIIGLGIHWRCAPSQPGEVDR